MDYSVIEMPSRLDMNSSTQVKHCIMEHYSAASGMLMLDFEKCKFIDSSGLALLIFSSQVAREECMGLRILRMCEQGKSLIKISHLDMFLPVYDDVHSALMA